MWKIPIAYLHGLSKGTAAYSVLVFAVWIIGNRHSNEAVSVAEIYKDASKKQRLFSRTFIDKIAFSQCLKSARKHR